MLQNSIGLSRLPCVLRLPACAVSTKYTKPHPRPYRRRLFEAAVLPVIPKLRTVCPSQKEFLENMRKQREEYFDMELAYVKHIRSWIQDEGYRMMAVCQYLPVNGRTEWLAQNQLRLKGLEFRRLGNRIVRKLFENTSLHPLDVVFVGSNCYLFGKDMESIRAVLKECEKLTWIEPMAITWDSRILSIDEARNLCKLHSFEDLRAETVQILGQVSQQAVSSLIAPLQNLSASLDLISSREQLKTA